MQQHMYEYVMFGAFFIGEIIVPFP